jgi:predicted secreted protein
MHLQAFKSLTLSLLAVVAALVAQTMKVAVAVEPVACYTQPMCQSPMEPMLLPLAQVVGTTQ